MQMNAIHLSRTRLVRCGLLISMKSTSATDNFPQAFQSFSRTITGLQPYRARRQECFPGRLLTSSPTGIFRTNDTGKKYFAASLDGGEIRWARFYNLTNSQPVFPGRDGIVYETFEAMAAKNKLGTTTTPRNPAASSPTARRNGARCWRTNRRNNNSGS